MKVYYTRDNVQNIDGFDRHAYPESIEEYKRNFIHEK